jgi:MYXO-CTERM domain-containing protein
VHLLLALATPALALPTYYSDPQPVVLSDDVPVFDVLTVDTGYLPGGVSPASVRFFVESSGGVSTDLEGVSYLAWPEAILHNIRGVPGTGYFSLDGGIDLQAEVFIDLGALFTGTIPLWVDSIPFADERRFEPLYLDGETVQVSGDATILPPLEFPLPVTDVVDVFLAVEAYPDVSATLTPLGVVTYHEDGTYHPQLSEDQSVLLPVPLDREALDLQSSFVSEVRSSMELVLEARVEVDTFIGPFTVFTFPIPITLVDSVDFRVSEPVPYSHMLPAISTLPESLDFGNIEVGQSVTLQLPVQNVGLRSLGTEAELGPGAFEVSPASAVIEPGEGGAYSVTFTPTEPGAVTSQVWIDSTDPGFPSVEVVLFASAYEPGTDDTSGPSDDDDDGDTITGPEDRVPEWVDDSEPPAAGGCGCDSSTPTHSLWLLLGVGLLVRRRS